MNQYQSDVHPKPKLRQKIIMIPIKILQNTTQKKQMKHVLKNIYDTTNDNDNDKNGGLTSRRPHKIQTTIL